MAEAARLLKVSTVTVHRWLKAGRLRAYHVGPKAVRIQRTDLAAIITPIRREEVTDVTETQLTSIHTAAATIRPLTEAQQRQALDALKASQESLAQQRAKRNGQPFDGSWPLIRAAREERSEQIR